MDTNCVSYVRRQKMLISTPHLEPTPLNLAQIVYNDFENVRHLNVKRPCMFGVIYKQTLEPFQLKNLLWSHFIFIFAPMRKRCENKSKEIENLINMCQNLSHSLGDKERKFLKDQCLRGRVVALRNIHNGMEEKSRCVFFLLLKRDPHTMFF